MNIATATATATAKIE